jgi:uncharacterized membrane protein
VSALFGSWGELNFLTQESLWILLGIALVYGLLRLARRRSYEYTADLVGLGAAGILVGGVLRFSGTLASFYSPERAAIFTAILLAAPVTLFLDDLFNVGLHRHRGMVNAVLGVGAAFLVFLVVQASGLGTLLVGGQPPGSLTANGLNAEDFTVSTPELATAVWLREHVKAPDIVQSDLYGHLVLLSEPGSYDLIFEIVPPEVDQSAYIYLTPVNLFDGLSQAETNVYQTAYRSNVRFFNRHFYVVYSTGSTRVYH